MSLVTPGFLRSDLLYSDRQPDDNFLNNRILEAENELRSLVSDSEYEAAEAAFTSGTPVRKEKLFQLAESKLVMCFSISILNVKVSELGVIQEATSKNFGEATFRVASPGETEKLKAGFYSDALRLINPYIQGNETVLPTGE